MPDQLLAQFYHKDERADVQLWCTLETMPAARVGDWVSHHTVDVPAWEIRWIYADEREPDLTRYSDEKAAYLDFNTIKRQGFAP